MLSLAATNLPAFKSLYYSPSLPHLPHPLHPSVPPTLSIFPLSLSRAHVHLPISFRMRLPPSRHLLWVLICTGVSGDAVSCCKLCSILVSCATRSLTWLSSGGLTARDASSCTPHSLGGPRTLVGIVIRQQWTDGRSEGTTVKHSTKTLFQMSEPTGVRVDDSRDQWPGMTSQRPYLPSTRRVDDGVERCALVSTVSPWAIIGFASRFFVSSGMRTTPQHGEIARRPMAVGAVTGTRLGHETIIF